MDIGTIWKGFTIVATKVRTASKNHALSEVRKDNGNCLHIHIKEDMGKTFYDLSGPKDINLSRGTIFWTRGYMFHHPNPHFTPAGKIESISRTHWKEGGLNPENNMYPVGEDSSYKGYFNRRIAGDKGGGETREGFCALCSLEASANQ